MQVLRSADDPAVRQRLDALRNRVEADVAVGAVERKYDDLLEQLEAVSPGKRDRRSKPPPATQLNYSAPAHVAPPIALRGHPGQDEDAVRGVSYKKTNGTHHVHERHEHGQQQNVLH